MVCGIADVGSNTIRLSIYKCENGEGRLLLNRKVTAGLAGYVQQGALTQDGIHVACQTLLRFRTLLDNLEISDFHVFATASLRNISNTEEAVRAITADTGLRVDVLSGREEAALSFRGAIRDAERDDGLLVDLGGGSTELVSYTARNIQTACSLPAGSLSLFNRCVSGLHPTKGERKAIRDTVENLLERYVPQRTNTKYICGVGGTIRAACKVANLFFDRPAEQRTLETEALRTLLRRFRDVDRPALELLLKAAPDRIHTLLPGMLALDVVARAYGAERITVSSCGVREGYLYSRVLEQGRES
ncbi:MAG: phosphatase [Oscillospiraceae bacterium]|nr:phosphatase [Oscillospiraceae bacterium]